MRTSSPPVTVRGASSWRFLLFSATRAVTRVAVRCDTRCRAPARREEWYSRLMPDRSSKRPRDINELGRQIVDEATGEAPPFDPDEGKDPAAVALGRKGGLKGGKARAAKMSPEQLSAAARKAAKARWSRRSTPPS
jgi:hypothetical protein